MATKNLAVREEVYKVLMEMKGEKESFSDVIKRLAKGRGSILKFSGCLSKDKVWDEIKREITEARSHAVLRT